MDSFRQGLEDAWARIAVFVPKFIGFLLILIIGYFVAKWIGTAFDKVLERVGFDRAVERGGVKRALARTKYDASDLVGKLVFYVLFLFVLQLAFGIFGPNPISDLIEGVISYLPNVVVAILIIVIASAIAAAVRELTDAALGNLSYGRLLANIAGGAILTVGIFAAISQLEIAPDIVNALFYAILVLVVGILVVAVGGGGIQAMRERWARALDRLDEEIPKAQAELQGSEERVESRANAMKNQIRDSQAQTP